MYHKGYFRLENTCESVVVTRNSLCFKSLNTVVAHERRQQVLTEVAPQREFGPIPCLLHTETAHGDSTCKCDIVYRSTGSPTSDQGALHGSRLVTTKLWLKRRGCRSRKGQKEPLKLDELHAHCAVVRACDRRYLKRRDVSRIGGNHWPTSEPRFPANQKCLIHEYIHTRAQSVKFRIYI